MYIISDEIYEHINFVGGHECMAQFDFIKDRVALINGVSKGFSMTGWRGGILAAPKWLAQACDKMQGQFTSATSSITQKAMHKAMELDFDTYIKPMRDAFHKRRDLVLSLMKEIPGFKTNNPQGAFYVFPEVSYYFGKSYNGKTIANATDISLFLLEEAHVALVPGAAFGAVKLVLGQFVEPDELGAVERLTINFSAALHTDRTVKQEYNQAAKKNS